MQAPPPPGSPSSVAPLQLLSSPSQTSVAARFGQPGPRTLSLPLVAAAGQLGLTSEQSPSPTLQPSRSQSFSGFDGMPSTQVAWADPAASPRVRAAASESCLMGGSFLEVDSGLECEQSARVDG